MEWLIDGLGQEMLALILFLPSLFFPVLIYGLIGTLIGYLVYLVKDKKNKSK